ncbi:TetR/AcrR family transcriptional regulator [bacterium]|nr:TetR/AcrR family transcriptional regulator [bacterium]
MGTHTRRAREKMQRQQDILRVAKTMFWKQGFQNTTMKQIADAAELAAGTLYLYFPSKKEIYAELLIQGYDLLIQKFTTVLKMKIPPREKAAKLIDAFFDFAASYPEYFDIIFFIVQREGKSVEEVFLRQDYFIRLDRKETACKALIRQFLSEIRPTLADTELELTVEAVWTMLTGVVFFYFRDEPGTFQAIASRARDLILTALLV